MKKLIPKEKLGKKARKQLDSEQRTTWAFSPVTKKWKAKSSTTARENPMTVMMITAWAFLMGSDKAAPDLFNKLFRNGGKCLVSIPYQI